MPRSVRDQSEAVLSIPASRRLVGAMLLSLCGCASQPAPPPLSSGVAVPPAWSIPAGAPGQPTSSLQQWWSGFDDALLNELVEQALRANTSIRSARAALQQARALREVAGAQLWPRLSGAASAQHTTGGNGAAKRVALGLDAGWELDLFGANRSALGASVAAEQASAAGLGGTQVSIAAEVVLAYLTLRGGQARLAIARDNLAIQNETWQITRWRNQAGLLSALEVEQARAAAEQTGAQLPSLQSAIAQSSHALAVLCGQAPAALSNRLSDVAPVPRARAALALEIPAETLRQRPDVRAAEYQLTAASARVDAAQAARLPNFQLSGSLGLSALTVGALGAGGSLASTLMAQATAPLVDGGARRAQVRAQQAALEQSRAAYQASVLGALQEVEDALIALRGDNARLLRLHEAADAGTAAARMARQRFTSGVVDFQTVLDTQRTQLNTQDSLVSATVDVSADHVRLVKALGGGWRMTPDPLAPALSPTQSHAPERP